MLKKHDDIDPLKTTKMFMIGRMNLTILNYFTLLLLCLPFLLFLGRKTHFYYLDKKNGRKNDDGI
ncbi:hypothetical protein CD148_11815 [Staphylococcus delphini]|uniref:Uncharacterized protein n=2 Tax=Staphylococcus delphini TaxID=53344 RepID=A0AAX0QQU3_9STAP|nr:hypothetical protein [Staphylococcus delphini]PCF46151.1 hypothetical protein B5C07_12650 [Staphylococcus delphini]PNZ90147.1 hypothetical protein CD148_11815 [Staphylococcus delphini]